MFYVETQRLCTLLEIAIVVILVVGFMGGIGTGVLLRDVSNAIDDISFSVTENMDISSYDVEESAIWGFESILGMIAVWFSAAFIALLLFALKCHIEMQDATVRFLKDIQLKVETLCDGDAKVER